MQVIPPGRLWEGVDEDELSLRELQELDAVSRTPTPPLFSHSGPGSSSTAAAWAPGFLRGDRPVTVEDSTDSLETAIALAQGLQLPGDMVKEKESTLDRLERTAVSHRIRVRYSLVCYTSFLCFSMRSLILPSPFSSLLKRW